MYIISEFVFAECFENWKNLVKYDTCIIQDKFKIARLVAKFVRHFHDVEFFVVQENKIRDAAILKTHQRLRKVEFFGVLEPE